MQGQTTLRLIAAFEREVASLSSVLRTGSPVDLDEWSQSLGSTLEYMLCDFFRQHESAARYWVDGFLIKRIESMPDDSIVLEGRIWCADHERQWLVPARALITPRRGAGPGLAICVGDACLLSLANHRGHDYDGYPAPAEWLLEFELEGAPGL